MAIPAQIEGCPVTALIDTACSYTIIKQRLASCFKHRELQPTTAIVSSITGETIELIASMVVSLQVGRYRFPHRVYITKESPTDFIVGKDLLEREDLEVVIHCSRSLLYLRGEVNHVFQAC